MALSRSQRKLNKSIKKILQLVTKTNYLQNQDMVDLTILLSLKIQNNLFIIEFKACAQLFIVHIMLNCLFIVLF